MTQDKQKLLEQLEALKQFPKNKLVKELQKQIKSKLEKIEQKEKIVEVKEETEDKTNLSRSSKLKKYHRYLRLIRDNFPDLSYSQIRKQFSQRKQGNDVSIPDVVWQNPSP
jgi:hypothetical protein